MNQQQLSALRSGLGAITSSWVTYLREATLFILTTAVHCCEPYETISIDDNTLVIRYASQTITTAFRRNPVSYILED